MSAVEEDIVVDPAPAPEEAVAAPEVVAAEAPEGVSSAEAAAPPPPPPEEEEEKPKEEEEAAPVAKPETVEEPAAVAPAAPAAPAATSAPAADPAPTKSSKPAAAASQKKKKTTPPTTSTTKAAPAATTNASTHRGGSARAAATTTTKAEMTTGVHVNARYQTAGEEHARFREQHKVRPTYKGPVYVAEDVHVLCAECHTAVDPVSRVPVGSRFYHEHCVRCSICGRRGVAEPFLEQAGLPVCAACVEKGNAAGQVRRMHPATAAPARRKSQHQPQQQQLGPHTLNQTAVPGAVPPSLQVTPHLHDSRNTTARTFALIQRQQYFTQNDANILTQMPPEEERRGQRRKSSVKKVEGRDTIPALE